MNPFRDKCEQWVAVAAYRRVRERLCGATALCRACEGAVLRFAAGQERMVAAAFAEPAVIRALKNYRRRCARRKKGAKRT